MIGRPEAAKKPGGVGDLPPTSSIGSALTPFLFHGFMKCFFDGVSLCSGGVGLSYLKKCPIVFETPDFLKLLGPVQTLRISSLVMQTMFKTMEKGDAKK